MVHIMPYTDTDRQADQLHETMTALAALPDDQRPSWMDQDLRFQDIVSLIAETDPLSQVP